MTSILGRAIKIPLTGSRNGPSTGGNLYGDGNRAVILSNMNTNDQGEWRPLLGPLLRHGFQVLTYDYPDPQADQWAVLLDVISYSKKFGAEKIVLIGASRGGVTSMQVLARSRDLAGIVGVAAISSPVEHEGAVFFSPEELARVSLPKLFINTEHDECAAGTRRMYDLVPAPKEMVFYPGSAHGTEIFSTADAPGLLRHLLNFTVGLMP